MRRLTKPGQKAAPLDEPTTLMLLLGDDAPGINAVSRLSFTSDGNVRNAARLWQAHERYLRAEAKARGIERPPDPDMGRDAFYGERCCWLVETFERYGA